jgi:hypothetical protein
MLSRKAGSAASEIVEEVTDGVDTKKVRGMKKVGTKIRGSIVGVVVSLGVNAAMGAESDLDPLDPGTMGNAEIRPWTDQDYVRQYDTYQRYLDELAFGQPAGPHRCQAASEHGIDLLAPSPYTQFVRPNVTGQSLPTRRKLLGGK